MEVAQAALIMSFLQEEGIRSSTSSKPLSECEFNPRSSAKDHTFPPHLQGPLGLLHSTPASAQVQPTLQVTAPSTAGFLTQPQPTYSTMRSPPVAISNPARQLHPSYTVGPTRTHAPLPSVSRPVASISQPQLDYGQAQVQHVAPPAPHQQPMLQAARTFPYPYTAMPPLPQQVTAPPPGTDLMELLVATSYGIPRPALPHFSSERESDFALLKMALDNLLNTHSHLTEQFKYQILLDHLKLPSAYKLAQAYMHDPRPYPSALRALQDKYGQPRQLVQSELGAILNSPPVRPGDPEAFDNFALSVQALVGMLRSLEGDNGYELRCGSHVDRLLSKLPANYLDGFVEHSINHGILRTGTDQTYTLTDFSAWLQLKSQAKRISSRAALMFQDQSKPVKSQRKPQAHSSSIYYNTEI